MIEPKKNKNIFDLENLDDLPEKFRVKFIKKMPYIAFNIFCLFEIKATLSISEIQVALYRIYGKIFERSNVSTYCSYLRGPKNLIRRSYAVLGQYTLIDKFDKKNWDIRNPSSIKNKIVKSNKKKKTKS